MARRSWWVAMMLVVAVLTGGLVAVDVATAPPSSAAAASDFRPGNIISDALFFDGSAMGEGDVQAFLNVKRPTCTAGYTCLKDYVTATTSQAAEAGLCGAYTGRAAETAAQVIAHVGAACGISQKVLLVLLQKEQGLVTASAPTDARYRSATGFACPDSAPCDAQYYGFFNQVYRAARQFKKYALTPQNYTYRVGRTVNVLYNPDAARCGSSPVFIENQATAGLYTYTPYQPNASALANMYTTGDSCSSYGNRNFFREFSDWFGSTQFGANLVKAAGSPTVYLLTIDGKHQVQNPVILDSLSSLGGVATISQSVLDMRPTGVALGRFIRDRAGKISLFDRGYLFSVPDCAMLADWGASCDSYGSLVLSDAQMAGFTNGGVLSQSYTTVEGSWFYVHAGKRSEVFDAASLALAPAAPTTPTTHLNDAAGADLPITAPLVRPGVVVRNAATGAGVLVDASGSTPVSAALLGQSALTRVLPTRTFDSRSVAAMTTTGSTLSGVVKAADSTRYGLTGSGAVRLGAELPASVTGPVVSAAVLAALAPTTPSGPVFVRSAQSPALYLATAGTRRPVATMDTVVALTAGAPLTVVLLEQASLDAIPQGGPVLTPGSVVKSSAGADLFLVDGLTVTRHVPSFALLAQLGLSGYKEVPPASLAGYTAAPGQLGTLWACGSQKYVAIGGSLRPITAAAADATGLAFVATDPSTCGAVPRSSTQIAGPLFVRSAQLPDLYLASGGKRRAVSSMSTVYGLAAGAPVAIATFEQAALDALPLGAPVLDPGRAVKSSTGADIYLVDGPSTLRHVPSFAVLTELGVTGYTTVPAASLTGYAVAPGELGTLWACGAQRYVGTGGSLRPLSAAAADATGLPFVAMDAMTCAALPRSTQQLTGPLFVRSAQSPALFLAAGGTRRPITSMDTVYTLAAGGPVVIATVEQSVLDALPLGSAVLTPGRVVKSVAGPDVFLVDGASTLRHVPSFTVLAELGAGALSELPATSLTGYATAAGELGTLWSCGGQAYVGTGGSLRPLSAAAATATGLSFVPTDPSTCAGLPRTAAVLTGPLFVRSTGSPVIYLASGGQRRPVTSMSTVYALAGGGPVVIATLEQAVLGTLPQGPAV
ncbi:hypothetical protein [Cellulomonas sp. P5_C6]